MAREDTLALAARRGLLPRVGGGWCRQRALLMSARALAAVFDFDGTLTDPRPTVARFESVFFDALSRWLGGGDALALCEAAEDVESEGVAVVRSSADPWLRATAVARASLVARGLSTAAIDDAVRQCFHSAYDAAPCPLRDGVAALFEALIAQGHAVAVVSNSPRDRVMARLADAGLSEAARAAVTVVGGAQKFTVVSPSSAKASGWLESMGASRSFAGAPRPVALARGRYLDALASISERAGVEPSSMVLCGDVFELDLAVALALGARTVMVAHDGARAWERDAVLRAGGAVIDHGLPSRDALIGR
jgi:phosphoglycolate phosphatase-like HAD superfamily hydrolase